METKQERFPSQKLHQKMHVCKEEAWEEERQKLGVNGNKTGTFPFTETAPEDACLQRGSLGGRETEVRCKWKQNRNVSLHRNCTSKTNAISMNHEA